MVDIQSAAAESRQGKKIEEEEEEEERKKETTGQKYNDLPYYIGRPVIKITKRCKCKPGLKLNS